MTKAEFEDFFNKCSAENDEKLSKDIAALVQNAQSDNDVTADMIVLIHQSSTDLLKEVLEHFLVKD